MRACSPEGREAHVDIFTACSKQSISQKRCSYYVEMWRALKSHAVVETALQTPVDAAFLSSQVEDTSAVCALVSFCVSSSLLASKCLLSCRYV